MIRTNYLVTVLMQVVEYVYKIKKVSDKVGLSIDDKLLDSC